MTKFAINAENVKRLSTLGGQSKELISLTKPIFCPSDGTLSVNLYSPRVTMTFAVDIKDFTSDDTEELNFFSMGIDEFNSTLSTVSKGYSEEVAITVDKANNKVTFVNETSGTKVSRGIFNATVTLEEAKASITAVEDMKAEYLTDPVSLTVTNEVSAFFESASKFMNLIKNQNTISVCGDTVKYADQLVVLKKKLSKSVSDTEVYLKRQLYDAIKPFLKLSDELTVYLTKNFNIAFFESKDMGYKATISLEEARYAYPTDEELASVLPVDSRLVRIKATKANLKAAFEPFNNTFKSSGDNWNWKATTLDSSKANVDAGKLVLKYTDYTGSAESVIPVSVEVNTEGNDNGELIISIQLIEELMNLIPEEDITITYNSLAPNVANGALVKFETDTVTATAIKFRKAQN